MRLMLQLDLDDILPVTRRARDHERLREPEADDAGVDVHAATIALRHSP
jgi:hypothetical protein